MFPVYREIQQKKRNTGFFTLSYHKNDVTRDFDPVSGNSRLHQITFT